MSLIITCPSCGGKLRVADDLRGRRVRCPTCERQFEAPSANAPTPLPPEPRDFPLDLSLGEAGAPSAPSSDAPGLLGAVELKPVGQTAPAPPPPSPEPPWRTPPRLPEDDYDEDVPSFRRRPPPRRDCEPDRGSVVLTLGIISLVCMVLCVTSPIGLILGICAWVMGQNDLRKMRRGDMDPRGEGATQAGWICGIIGTVLNALVALLCSGYLSLFIFAANAFGPPARPLRPTAPPPIQKNWAPPKAKAPAGPDW